MRGARERGATAVEYALGLGLFVLVIVGGLQWVQDRTDERRATDQAAIARTENLGTVPSTTSPPSTAPAPTTTSTTTPPTTDDPPTTTTSTSVVPPTTVPTPQLTATCTGRRCTFVVSGAASDATFRWVVGSETKTLSDPTISYEPGSNGKENYQVKVTVSPPETVHEASVACEGGNGSSCVATITVP